MISTLLLGLLAASPVEGKVVVVVSNSPELAAQAKKALEAKGALVVDGSDVYNALLGSDGARFRLAPGATRFEPVSDLARPVRADFERGLKGCRRSRNASSWDACLNQLTQAVWQRHLQRQKADWVYRFRRVDRPGDTAFAANVTVYAVDARRQLTFGAGSAGPKASLANEVQSALKRVEEDGRPNRPREVYERLP